MKFERFSIGIILLSILAAFGLSSCGSLDDGPYFGVHDTNKRFVPDEVRAE